MNRHREQSSNHESSGPTPTTGTCRESTATRTAIGMTGGAASAGPVTGHRMATPPEVASLATGRCVATATTTATQPSDIAVSVAAAGHPATVAEHGVTDTPSVESAATGPGTVVATVAATVATATATSGRRRRAARWLAGAVSLALSLALFVTTIAFLAGVAGRWAPGSLLTDIGAHAPISALSVGAGEQLTVLAQGGDPGGVSLNQFLTNVRNVLIGLLATLTVCYLTIGGIRMIIASGEPGEVERAKSALRSAAFGFLATVLAPAFVGVLQSLFGGGGR